MSPQPFNCNVGTVRPVTVLCCLRWNMSFIPAFASLWDVSLEAEACDCLRHVCCNIVGLVHVRHICYSSMMVGWASEANPECSRTMLPCVSHILGAFAALGWFAPPLGTCSALGFVAF
jgi:hypothetical protein